MKRQLNMIVAELRRLKEDGVTVLNVSDDTLRQLRERTRALSGEKGTTAVVVSEGQSRGTGESDAGQAPKRSRFEAAGAARLPDFNPESQATAKIAAPTTAPKRKLPSPPKIELPEGNKGAKWEALRRQVLGCPTCNDRLKPNCKVVFGVGNLDADIFFVGEAPGADEEIAGEPFVGKAGELLTRMIGAMGVKREDVYIGNIMNWRPDTETGTGNRPPTPEEMAFCLPYLLAQIDIVRPKVIVALGNTAVAGLLGPDPKRRLKDVRGQWKEFHEIPTIITYHPAYLVRNASTAVKRTVWEDLLKVMDKVGLPISEKQRNYFLPKR